jgi:hypothetical protein
MQHVLCAPLHALRVSITQVTNIHFSGNRIFENGLLIAGYNTEAATVAFFRIHLDGSQFIIPRKGVTFAGRQAFFALDAQQGSINSLFFSHQDFDPGPSRVEFFLVREGANLFADTTTAAFFMIDNDFWSTLADFHFKPPLSYSLGLTLTPNRSPFVNQNLFLSLNPGFFFGKKNSIYLSQPIDPLEWGLPTWFPVSR